MRHKMVRPKEPENQRQNRLSLIKSFLTPVNPNFHYPCIFTRRYIKKKKSYHYYLYSTDEEFLFCVATCNENDSFFKLSMNSNDLDDKSWCVGSLQGNQNSQFMGIEFRQNENENEFVYRNSICIDINPESKAIQVRIPPPEQMEFLFIGNSNDYQPLIFTQDTKTQNNNFFSYNLGLEYNGMLSLTVTQTHKDEFQLQCSNPLSLFQGFCICIAISSTLV